LVEHRTENPGVAGSIPAGTTKQNLNPAYSPYCGILHLKLLTDSLTVFTFILLRLVAQPKLNEEPVELILLGLMLLGSDGIQINIYVVLVKT
jgi:hypothetical protein